MPRLGEVIGTPPDPEEGPGPEQQLFEAFIENTPKANGDEVFVTINEFDDGKHKFGPVIWNPIELGGKEIFPQAGDICLVAKPTITGSVWLLAWR